MIAQHTCVGIVTGEPQQAAEKHSSAEKLKSFNTQKVWSMGRKCKYIPGIMSTATAAALKPARGESKNSSSQPA